MREGARQLHGEGELRGSGLQPMLERVPGGRVEKRRVRLHGVEEARIPAEPLRGNHGVRVKPAPPVLTTPRAGAQGDFGGHTIHRKEGVGV